MRRFDLSAWRQWFADTVKLNGSCQGCWTGFEDSLQFFVLSSPFIKPLLNTFHTSEQVGWSRLTPMYDGLQVNHPTNDKIFHKLGKIPDTLRWKFRSKCCQLLKDTDLTSPTSALNAQPIRLLGYFPGCSLKETVNLAKAAKLTNLIVALQWNGKEPCWSDIQARCIWRQRRGFPQSFQQDQFSLFPTGKILPKRPVNGGSLVGHNCAVCATTVKI